MRLSLWFRPSRRLLLMFLLLSMGPAAALGWMSWRLLEQEQALAWQRIGERIEVAADVASAYLRDGQAEVEQRLASLASQPQGDLAPEESGGSGNHQSEGLWVVFGQEHVRAFPRELLLYYPTLAPVPAAPPTRFSAGEEFEFRRQDYERAAAIYRKLGVATDSAIRAEALVREARCLRKAGRLEEALETYRELGRLGDFRLASVEVPAELLGRYSECTVLGQMNRSHEMRDQADALLRDLQLARWPLRRAEYEYYRREAQRWLGQDAADSIEPLAEKLAMADGVAALWDEWQHVRSGTGSRKGRRSLWLRDRPVLVVWDSTPRHFVALVAGPRYIEEKIRALMATGLAGRELELSLVDAEGHAVLGRIPPPGRPRARRSAAELRLPWSLYLTNSNPAADIAELASHRRLLFGGLGMMGVVLVAGLYFIGRSVARELELAQLKSDFVGAVSHEFRSPLTSMRQITGMLAAGRVPTEERTRSYYEVLSRETARLQRLVEGLLNFGRIEAGAMEYYFETLDASALARLTVTDFEREVRDDGYRVDFVADGPGPLIRADREALSRALWNLLDNAVKYSPDCRTVRVELARKKSELFVRVQDGGVGIPAGEQREIFRKFVRGAAAASTHAKGTGIGLAMVAHIVRAHGGTIRVESECGRGSTFTIVLPVED
jgi:signal transduction histidine kinase